MTKYTIVVLKEGKPPEAFRDLRFYCKVSGLSYSTISKKKLPFEYNGKTIYRCLLMPEEEQKKKL